DLLVSCIAFLLITAVWSHLDRLRADAQVPGSTEGVIRPQPPEKVLHVEMRQDDAFTLSWKQGITVISATTVPRHAVELGGTVRYPELAAKLVEEWQINGSHRDPADRGSDQVVLHTGDRAIFKEMVAVMDAIAMPKRDRAGQMPAFSLSLSRD